MKLRNKMNDVRQLRDKGQVVEVGPKETVEVSKPSYNPNAFEVIHTQKSKEKKDLKTLDTVEKEKNYQKEVKK